MAPLVAVPSLLQISQYQVIIKLKAAFKALNVDEYQSVKMTELQSYFEHVPVILLDKLAEDLLEANVKREHVDFDMMKDHMVKFIREIKEKEKRGELSDDEDDDENELCNFDAPIASVPFTLLALTNSSSQKLIINQNYDLNKKSKNIVQHFFMIKESLVKTSNLRKLLMKDICTDEFLEVIGKNCRKLTELEISETNK